MADAAMFGARQLIDAPLDPQGNDIAPNSSHSYGIAALARGLVKFERWDDLLQGEQYSMARYFNGQGESAILRGAGLFRQRRSG